MARPTSAVPTRNSALGSGTGPAANGSLAAVVACAGSLAAGSLAAGTLAAELTASAAARAGAGCDCERHGPRKKQTTRQLATRCTDGLRRCRAEVEGGSEPRGRDEWPAGYPPTLFPQASGQLFFVLPSGGFRAATMWRVVHLSMKIALAACGAQLAAYSPTVLGLWTTAGGFCRGRKVRAPKGKVVGNAHRPRGQGQCHREQTAGRPACWRRQG